MCVTYCWEDLGSMTKAMHDGKKNTYRFDKDGINHTLLPMEEEDASRRSNPKTLLLSGKEYLQQIVKYCRLL